MACLVVSSTALRAQLLAGLLAQCCPVAIADACDSVEAALAAIDRCRPLVIILDRDGDCDASLRIARQLLQVSASARLILLPCDPCLEPQRRELAAPIDHPDSWQALIRCVRTSLPVSGDPAELGDPLPQPSCFERLRPRERTVLELVGSGLGNRDIARSLGVSRHTVETYRKSVSAKLGVSGARLVRIAVLYRCLQFCRPPRPGQGRDADGHGRCSADAPLESAMFSGDGESIAVVRVGAGVADPGPAALTGTPVDGLCCT